MQNSLTSLTLTKDLSPHPLEFSLTAMWPAIGWEKNKNKTKEDKTKNW